MKGWSRADVERLRVLYPKYPQRDIEKAFSRRTWKAIQIKASTLKIKRRVPRISPCKPIDTACRKPGLPVAIRAELRGARLAQRVAAKALSVEIGYCPNSVGRWERGIDRPGLLPLQDWANGLGYELAVIRKAI